ncbi:MAG: hypothetical protein Q9171_006501 [Xanthocarpia ochracea]
MQSTTANHNGIWDHPVNMTTSPTTIFVDGTPSAVPTSQATSIYGEEEAFESNATARYHLEHLAPPTARLEQHRPSTASFNSSLDRSNEETSTNAYPIPSTQNIRRDGGSVLLATPVDGVNDTSDHSSLQNGNSSSQLPSIDGDTTTQELLTTSEDSHHNAPISQPDHVLATSPSPSPSTRPNSTPPTHSQTSTPSPVSRQSPQDQSPTRFDQHGQRIRHHRRRRRLRRWFQRHLNHPLPWNLSLRRRAENIRRRIMDVDRLLP